MTDMAQSHISLSVKDLPEVIWTVRHEVARLLRATADGCRSPEAAAEVRRVADAVECGQAPQGDGRG